MLGESCKKKNDRSDVATVGGEAPAFAKSSVSVFGLVFILAFILVTAPFIPRAFSQECCESKSADDLGFNTRRIESARALNEEAVRLQKITMILERWATLLAQPYSRARPILLALSKETPQVDTEKGSVQETAARTKVSAENFQRLLLAYQDSRREYLQHKMIYDEHIAEFHRQAQEQPSGTLQEQSLQQQQQNASAGGPVIAPQLKRLKVKAQDACANLQQVEFALTTLEAQLAATINYLASIKGKVPEETYFQQWNMTQLKGSELQRQVVDFGRDVLNKEQTSVDQLHDLTQAAQRNGDFVQSKDIYFELQRSNALNNEETKRAHVHTMFAASALNAIHSLTPLTQAASPAQSPIQSAPQQTVTEDQIQRESQALEAEYNKLQQQYSEMEKSNPAQKSRH